jgi:riboflavin kinase/FMN adenylyltransferase
LKGFEFLMKVYSGIHAMEDAPRRAVIAIGVFDGLHRGHQQLLKRVKQLAQRIGGTPVVMTFDPHPVHVLKPDLKLPLIISLRHRLQLIERMGIPLTVVIPFTRRFSRLKPGSFIKRYLVDPLRPAAVIVGDDFRFGQDRIGTIAHFERFGLQHHFKVLTISASHHGRKTVSSTQIRELIASGDIARAKRLLGRPVSLLGKVVRGEGRGKSLGYPTANLATGKVLLPPLGVYLVYVLLNGRRYRGIANIGRRPTFHASQDIMVEVHIFGFHRSIYGQEMIVEIIRQVRDERFFHSRDELVHQIKSDVQKARRWFFLHSHSA